MDFVRRVKLSTFEAAGAGLDSPPAAGGASGMETPPNPTKKRGRVLEDFHSMKRQVWLPPQIAPLIEDLMAEGYDRERPSFLGDLLCEALLSWAAFNAELRAEQNPKAKLKLAEGFWLSHPRRAKFINEMRAIDEAVEKMTAGGAPCA